MLKTIEPVEYGSQQLQHLLKLKQHKPTQVVAVTGGKGGIGKTNLSVNLSIALADLNKKVLLFDADLGLANIDVLLNINVHKTLSHVINQHASLEEIIIDGPKGIKVIPSGSGTKQLANLSKIECAELIRAFDDINLEFDNLIIDTAAGISDDILMFSKAANEVLVIVCDEPTSITDAYALIKLLYNEHQQTRFHIIANMVDTYMDGHLLFKKLNRATERFLGLSLDLCGIVPYDNLLKKSVQKQKAIVEAYPNSLASNAIKRIARIISGWPIRQGDNSHIRFFWEKMLTYNQKFQGL